MSDATDTQDILQQLQAFREYTQRLQQQVQSAEEARQAAEEARQAAEEARQAAEEARQAVERHNQETTLTEFLESCHEHFQTKLTVETNVSRTTKGYTTPNNKWYPKYLKKWDEFPELQQTTFERVHRYYHPPCSKAPRLFRSVRTLQGDGDYLGIIGNEDDLRDYQTIAVNKHVEKIVNHLYTDDKAKETLHIKGLIDFKNRPNSLSELNSEVAECNTARTPPKVSKAEGDQVCVYKRDADGTLRPLLMIEYKATHKMTTNILKRGFVEMNVEDEVLNISTTPTEEPAKSLQNAKNLCAAVATQNFHYMMELRLSYGYITNGQAFVFLHIEEAKPDTLFYHLAVPHEIDVGKLDSSNPLTAISQVTSLCLMAFQVEQRSHNWLEDAVANLKIWQKGNDDNNPETPESEEKFRSPGFQGKNPTVRRRYNTRSAANCNLNDPSYHSDHRSDDSGGSKRSEPAHQVSTTGKEGVKRKRNKCSNDGNEMGGRKTQRPYCTQGCLLGLLQNLPLDEGCPNLLSHPKRGKHHIIDHKKFLKLVQDQLAHDLDHNFEPLGLQGSRGALFKITLVSHNYVFVGKGTVNTFIADLTHEGQVYKRLGKLQGTAVPVCLGNINLVKSYILDFGVWIEHMLLLSWGGEAVDIANKMSGLQVKIDETVTEVQEAGIIHNDVRLPNLLWNPERRRVMLVDFERAKVLSPNKTRKRNNNISGRKKSYCQTIPTDFQH